MVNNLDGFVLVFPAIFMILCCQNYSFNLASLFLHFYNMLSEI